MYILYIYIQHFFFFSCSIWHCLATVVKLFEREQTFLTPLIRLGITVLSNLMYIEGLPTWHSGKKSTCQCRRPKRCGFDPWVRQIPWSRRWQPSPVFLPGKFHGQRSLVGYSPRGHIQSDTTERTHMYIERPYEKKRVINTLAFLFWSNCLQS